MTCRQAAITVTTNRQSGRAQRDIVRIVGFRDATPPDDWTDSGCVSSSDRDGGGYGLRGKPDRDDSDCDKDTTGQSVSNGTGR